jgi:hypothetical protein
MASSQFASGSPSPCSVNSSPAVFLDSLQRVMYMCVPGIRPLHWPCPLSWTLLPQVCPGLMPLLHSSHCSAVSSPDSSSEPLASRCHTLTPLHPTPAQGFSPLLCLLFLQPHIFVLAYSLFMSLPCFSERKAMTILFTSTIPGTKQVPDICSMKI